jgi:hypothetical protein
MTTRSRKGYTRAVLGDYNVICDRTSFKKKASECEMEWNGLFVRDQSFETRQPMDLIRAFPDPQAVPLPRPGNADVFIDVGDVTPGDL